MSSVNLTNPVRNNLLALLNTNNQLDNAGPPCNRFARQQRERRRCRLLLRLRSERSCRRSGHLDPWRETGLSILDAADKGFNAITAQVKSLQAVVQQAQASPVGFDTKASATIAGVAVGWLP